MTLSPSTGSPQDLRAQENWYLRHFRWGRSRSAGVGNSFANSACLCRRYWASSPDTLNLARYGDSRYIYSANGFKDYAGLDGLGMNAYVGSHDRKDPVLSPIYADLK